VNAFGVRLVHSVHIGKLAGALVGLLMVVGLTSVAGVPGASAASRYSGTGVASVVRYEKDRAFKAATGTPLEWRTLVIHNAMKAMVHRQRAMGPQGVVPCLFDGDSDLDFISNVTPGSTITITCIGFLPDEQVEATEGSPLFITSGSPNDLDPNFQSFMTDSVGDLNATFVVPNPFTAEDPSATCPASASQLGTGETCFVVLADQAGNTDDAFLNYAPSCLFNGSAGNGTIDNVTPASIHTNRW
jgi:hypothetical protein